MNKKGFSPMIILAGILIIGSIAGLVYYGQGGFADILGYESVYKANYGHICCVEGPLLELQDERYADDKTSYSCDKNVDKCEVTLTGKISPVLTLGQIKAEWRECNVDGSNCGSWSSKTLQKGTTYNFDILVGKKIEFRQGISSQASYYSYEVRGKLYSLINQENGKIITGNYGSCYISDSLKGKVLSESPNPIPKGFTYCQNYITDFIQVATKTYSYNGQEIICQTKELYRIDKKTFEDGSVKKIQGERITAVECCPQEPNCDVNTFKFKTSVIRDCPSGNSYECANSGNPYPATQTTAYYYTCNDGTCVKNTKQVECTSDAVCIQRHGEGYVCDLTPANYGNCKKAPSGPYCGDGYCDIGESKATCPDDCELECAEGEKLVTTTKNVNCKFLFWFCDESVEKECQKTGWNWIKIIFIIVGILFGIFLLILIIRSRGIFRRILKI